MVESRQIDGRAVTFRHEPGTGPALVCVHGSADNHHVYDRLFDAMPGRDRYAINLPGRAGTDGPALVAEASKHRELTPIETGGSDWKAADSFDRMQDLACIRVPALIRRMS